MMCKVGLKSKVSFFTAISCVLCAVLMQFWVMSFESWVISVFFLYDADSQVNLFHSNIKKWSCREWIEMITDPWVMIIGYGMHYISVICCARACVCVPPLSTFYHHWLHPSQWSQCSVLNSSSPSPQDTSYFSGYERATLSGGQQFRARLSLLRCLLPPARSEPQTVAPLLFPSESFTRCRHLSDPASIVCLFSQLHFSLYVHGDFNGSVLLSIEENGTSSAPLVWERKGQQGDNWDGVVLQLDGLLHE